MEQSPGPSPVYVPTTFIAACLFVIASIMLAFALAYTRTIMIPFVIAVFLSYLLAPMVISLKKRLRLPHALAVFTTMILYFLTITVFILVIRGSVIRFIDSYYLYEVRFAEIAAAIARFFGKYKVELTQDSILTYVKQLPVFSYVQGAASLAMTFLIDFVLVTIFLAFLLSGSGLYEERSRLGAMIDAKVRSYVLTKIATSVLTALLVWLTYALLDLDMAFLFSLICLLLCFIPTIGPIVATLLPLPIALIQYTTLTPILLVVAIPTAIQIVLGNVLEPKLLGKGLGLHPIAILLALMFWGLIWGVAGMFLAVPITAVISIILEQTPITKRISQTLAGKSPI